MIHPNTELRFINKEIGHGVVATELIPAGTITWVLDRLDREFTPDQFHGMEPLYKNILDIYAYRNNKGNFILCWDNSRYINHSFNANCLTTAYDFEIAIRDIQPGEQLTDDYGYLNILEPFEAVDEGTERKIVYPDDLLNYHHEWDHKLLQVFGKIPKMQQPLKPLISQKLWDEIIAISDGKMKMASILKNHYQNGSL
ncbi:MAG: SET domain-containing protein [Maribacter sp.]|nr:SET domain-containing protein [Maribacter sp.]